MAVDRKAMAESLQKRVQQSYKQRGSGRFSNYFSQMPEGVDWWKCTEDSHVLDMIPWQIGDQYPSRNYPDLQPGDWVYVLDVWIHRGIGANDDNFVCPARNYNDPCPICEHQKVLRTSDDFSQEEVDSLEPKRRSSYLIHCHDNDKEYSKGVQLFEVAYWFMERHLSELARVPGRHGNPDGWVSFASPDKGEGKSVSFKREGSGAQTTQFLAHKFMDRDYDIPDDILDGTFSLDMHLVVPTYGQLEAALFGGTDEPAEPEEEKTASSPRQQGAVQEDAAETPEERERLRPRQERQRKTKEEIEGAGDNPCPQGYRFGVDIDKKAECADCPDPTWKACAAEQDRLKAEG